MCSPMAHFVCRMVLAVSVFIAFDNAKVVTYIIKKIVVIVERKNLSKHCVSIG